MLLNIYMDFKKRNLEVKEIQVKINQIREYGEITFVGTFNGRCILPETTISTWYCKGEKSEEELRTVQGTIHKTCKDTCITLGILQNEQEWDDCLQEIEESVKRKATNEVLPVCNSWLSFVHSHNPDEHLIW